jgi:hypothetical protein
MMGGIDRWVQLQMMVNSYMPNFDGASKETCRNYLTDLENFAKLNSLDSTETIKQALAKARGTAARLIYRQIQENPTIENGHKSLLVARGLETALIYAASPN